MAELPLTLWWTQGWDVDVRRFHSALWTQNCFSCPGIRQSTWQARASMLRWNFLPFLPFFHSVGGLFINSKIAPWGFLRVQLLDQAFKFNSLTMEFQTQFLWFLWCTVSGTIKMLCAFGPWSFVVAHLLCSLLGGESRQAQLNLQWPFFLRGPTSTSVSRTQLRMELHRLCGKRKWVAPRGLFRVQNLYRSPWCISLLRVLWQVVVVDMHNNNAVNKRPMKAEDFGWGVGSEQSRSKFMTSSVGILFPNTSDMFLRVKLGTSNLLTYSHSIFKHAFNVWLK